MERAKLMYHPAVIFSEKMSGIIALNILWCFMATKAVTLTVVKFTAEVWRDTVYIREQFLNYLLWSVAFIIWVIIDTSFLLWKIILEGWRFRAEMIEEWK